MGHHALMSQSGGDLGGNALLTEATAFRPALAHYFRRRVADANEVEDLVQEVFLRVAVRQGAADVGNLGAYLFQAASSVLADRHRRRAVRHAQDHVPFDSETHADADFDAARILESRQSLDAALAALRVLPDRTRTVFVLRRLDGQPYRDIAAQLGISVSAVEKHMVRATQHLLSATREAE
jgi:RNA polymerase sigma-70 factor (ECF subfamily)